MYNPNKPDLRRELVTNLPEHQVLLSFIDDVDCYDFIAWWESEGYDTYSKWSDAGRQHN